MNKQRGKRTKSLYVAVTPEMKVKIQRDADSNGVSGSMVIYSILKRYYWQLLDD